MYRVVVYEDARDQVDHLPHAGALAFVEVLGVLEMVPWNGRALHRDNPDGAVRQLVFGPHAEGLVTYLVLEREQQAHVLDVTWMG